MKVVYGGEGLGEVNCNLEMGQRISFVWAGGGLEFLPPACLRVLMPEDIEFLIQIN